MSNHISFKFDSTKPKTLEDIFSRRQRNSALTTSTPTMPITTPAVYYNPTQSSAPVSLQSSSSVLKADTRFTNRSNSIPTKPPLVYAMSTLQTKSTPPKSTSGIVSSIIPTKPVRSRPTYGQNTLAYFALQLKAEIERRATIKTDQPAAVTFQEKFSKCRLHWSVLMEHIIDKMDKVDYQYKNYDYCGMKLKLQHIILNISLSYIIIGADTKSGSGIFYDAEKNKRMLIINPDEMAQKNDLGLWNRFYLLTVKDKIDNFFIKLTDDRVGLMHLLAQYQNALAETEARYQENIDHMRALEVDNSRLVRLIATETETFNEQKKQLRNMEEGALAIDLRRVMDVAKADIAKNKLLHTECEEKMSKCSATIDRAAQEIKQANMQIHNAIEEAMVIIDFSYFLHDDYYPALDAHIFAEFVSSAESKKVVIDLQNSRLE